MADCSVSLNIFSRETIPSLVCLLKVPNFFTLPQYDGTVFKSRSFQFADATWFFEFQSDERWQRKNKDAEDEYDDRSFDVYLVRLNSVIRQESFNTVTLLDANDKKYDGFFTPTVFEEDKNKDHIAYFSNQDPSFDRRETLCLIIQLFCEKSTVSDEDEIQNTTNGDFEMETTKDDKNCNVTLGLSTKKSISSVACTLKIPNFFILPECDGSEFESRTLVFASAAWCFRFSSGMRWKSEGDIRNKKKYFKLWMVRLDSEISEQRIFYSVALLDKNDKEYSRGISWRLFKEDKTVDWVYFFDKPEYCFDRRDSLTLTIRLFYDKSTETAADPLQKTTHRGIEGLAQNMKSLLLNGQGSDVILKIEDNEFRAHKNILVVRSPVFASMFQHDTKENATGIVDIPHCSAAAFEVFLSYLYTGSTDVLTSKNVSDVFYIADKYQVNDLKSECIEFMENNLSVDNFCEVIALIFTAQ